MKKLLKVVMYLLILAVVVGGIGFVNFWYMKPVSINWFYNRVFLKFALDNPELLTSIRLLEPLGIEGHNGKLADESVKHGNEQFAQLKDDLKMLESYDHSGFTGQDRLSYEILHKFLQDQVDAEAFRYHDYPVNQLQGVQSDLPKLLTEQQQVTNAGEARNYIARLKLFPAKFDQVMEGLRLREEKKILPPRFVVDEVLDQMKGFIGTPAKDNILATEFNAKIDKIDAAKMDPATRDALKADVVKEIDASVYPSYRHMISYFEELQKKVTENNGVWALPNGEAFYAAQVRQLTTTDYKPEELHEIGLKEVERIGGEMEQILRDAGYTEGTLGERIDKLSKDPSQLYPDTDAGREQILADYQKIIDDITAGLDPYFSKKPEAKVKVQRVAAFSEKTAPGAYYQPGALDGSRPGTFFANLRSVGEIPKLGMHTLAYHEAVPGHHFQISIAQELKGLPMFRRLLPFTAYAEGWALYSERLAWEAGFEKDPMDNLGRLQAEMFRAVRLVVDTGIHSKHWTREQSIAFMIEKTGMGEKEVTAEIERYFVWPGQALAYKVGMLKILELRDRARDQLGARFDIRDFHKVVLENGSLPMNLLEDVVNQYIKDKKAAA